MISKRIHCKVENDNYGRLANYIADASHAGEKALASWCAGTYSGDDYNLAIAEVLATQELNTRSTKEKTYHLVVSFRTEDEGKLTPDDYKAIEKRFAEALGLADHQRHCGIHKNTDNLHMHIAYNLIHPESLSRHEPFRDYKKRNALCRELEKEYGIAIDNGIAEQNAVKLSDQANKIEALKGEESFEGYVLRHHDSIMHGIEKAKSWSDVHEALATFSLELKTKGNGFIIKNQQGKQSMKASKLDRRMSCLSLTKYFGAFTPHKKVMVSPEKYCKRPIQKSQYTNPLWAEFSRKTQQEYIAQIKEKWLKEWIKISNQALSAKARNDLFKRVKAKRAKEINAVLLGAEVKNQNWLQFLQDKASAGDEKALAVLRSRKEETASEKILNIQAAGKRLVALRERQAALERKDTVFSKDIAPKQKQSLLAVSTMQEVTEASYTITRTGAVIFELPDGGKIIDTGRDIKFTDAAREIAQQYAAKKWGVGLEAEEALGGKHSLSPADRMKKRSPEKEMRRGF
jgi:hypothetical protein